MATADLTDKLEALLEIHPNIMVQKWAGYRDTYEIKLGSGNSWGKGITLLEAIEDAMKRDPNTIKGVPGEIL